MGEISGATVPLKRGGVIPSNLDQLSTNPIKVHRFPTFPSRVFLLFKFPPLFYFLLSQIEKLEL